MGEMKSSATFAGTRELSDLGFWSAVVPTALAGVSPASLLKTQPWLMEEHLRSARVFGETPKAAVGTTASPQSQCIVQ
jgi:hypothetical protein